MIWILDNSQDTLQEILERIKKFALPVAMAQGIKLDCINLAAADEQAVTKTKKRNLMLIAKESINNSFKYSGCKNIQVTLSQVNRKASLVISDDGRGFDTAVATQGNGLGNIQYRAKQINAVAKIVSAPGAGTVVTITQY
jgi:signal transduction histidine kinase